MPSRAPVAQLMACLDGQPPVNGDWADVIAVANRTLTAGTLAQCQLRNGTSVALPEDVRGFFATVHARTRARNRRMRDQLAEAVICLNRANITPMLIKGAALLAMPVDARGRMLADLDLMVPASALADAGEALGAIGYAPQDEPSDPAVAEVFWRSRDTGTIDLHCRLQAPRPYFDFARLAQWCAPAGVGAGEALLPSPTAQALILILHDQLQDRDYWRGLVDMRHVLDIAALARTPEGIDWDLLASWFPEGQPQSALRTQLVTIEALRSIGVPPPLIADRWPRLQHRRRMLQAHWPLFGAVFTLLTLTLDPPRGGGRAANGSASAARGGRARSGVLARAFSAVKRFHRSKAPGKL